jgi:hypothetical protein
VEKIMTGQIGDDLAEILPFVMYSGITSNNPGQKYECEHAKSALPYNYFLVDWRNESTNIDTFTGLCVPEVCNKTEIAKAMQSFVKNGNVYDYPANAPADPLMVLSAVVVGLWVGVLTVWSIVLSCRAPVENELIKKHEEVRAAEGAGAVNSLVTERAEVLEDFKLFNFYEGYCRIYTRSPRKSILSPVLFLAVLSLLFSMECSFRQTIAANEPKALRWFNSFAGVLFCNVELVFSVVVFVLGTKLAGAVFKLGSFRELGRYFFDELLTKWAVLVLVSMAAYFCFSLTDEPLNQLWRSSSFADCSPDIYQVWFVFRSLQFDGRSCMPWLWVMESDIFLTLLAAPLFIIYRTRKSLGHALFALVITISIVVGFAVLDSENVVFEPYKIFNQSADFNINYQANAIVRMWPYFLGFLFGLKVSEGQEKDAENESEHALAKAVRRNHKLQLAMQGVGCALMLAMWLLIIPYLPTVAPGETRSGAYGYIVFAPFGYLVGLMLFLLPLFWQGEGRVTVLVNKVMNWGVWDSLDKMTPGLLGLGPVVMGFTTYSMQNSIYFDFETLVIYFLGDAVVIYVVAMLAVAAIVHQLHFLSKWLQARLFKHDSKYSVLVLED